MQYSRHAKRNVLGFLVLQQHRRHPSGPTCSISQTHGHHYTMTLSLVPPPTLHVRYLILISVKCKIVYPQAFLHEKLVVNRCSGHVIMLPSTDTWWSQLVRRVSSNLIRVYGIQNLKPSAYWKGVRVKTCGREHVSAVERAMVGRNTKQKKEWKWGQVCSRVTVVR
ncbi:hypothetical protein ACFX2H_041970 [Malus domestica]